MHAPITVYINSIATNDDTQGKVDGRRSRLIVGRPTSMGRIIHCPAPPWIAAGHYRRSHFPASNQRSLPCQCGAKPYPFHTGRRPLPLVHCAHRFAQRSLHAPPPSEDLPFDCTCHRNGITAVGTRPQHCNDHNLQPISRLPGLSRGWHLLLALLHQLRLPSQNLPQGSSLRT